MEALLLAFSGGAVVSAARAARLIAIVSCWGIIVSNLTTRDTIVEHLLLAVCYIREAQPTLEKLYMLLYH